MAYGIDASPEEIEAVRSQYADGDNVAQFPTQPVQAEWLIGPFSEHRVLVDGRVMPLLTALREDDKVWLIVDHRFACGPFTTEEDAKQAARLAGQAMAVTAGYPHLGADDKRQPFAPISSAIDTLPSA